MLPRIFIDTDISCAKEIWSESALGQEGDEQKGEAGMGGLWSKYIIYIHASIFMKQNMILYLVKYNNGVQATHRLKWVLFIILRLERFKVHTSWFSNKQCSIWAYDGPPSNKKENINTAYPGCTETHIQAK